MPTKFRVEALLEGISASDYVVERDSTAFRELAKTHLALRKMEFQPDTASTTSHSVQRLATRPSTGYIPSKFVDWLTGDQLEFVDHITYDRAHLPCADGSYRLSVQCMVPWLGPKRADINVTLCFQPAGQRCCRQVLEGTVAIKIPGVGRVAEPLIVNGLRQAYASLPKLVAQWVAHRTALQADRRAHILTRGVPAPVLAMLEQGAPLPGCGAAHHAAECLEEVAAQR